MGKGKTDNPRATNMKTRGQIVSSMDSLVGWLLNIVGLHSLYSIRRRGPLREDGWFKSFREKKSVDANGNPIPWITYPAIEFIRSRVKPEMAVFEYGCGASTLWWAGLVREVVAVEHDHAWFQEMSSRVPGNVNLMEVALDAEGAYSKTIALPQFRDRFDIVFVDGRDRVNCIKNCLSALTASGIIILDNSDRPEYGNAVDYLLESGFSKIEFVGLCPIVSFKSETAIFYRAGNGFGI